VTASIPRLTGQDWQDWANKLLSCHYGPTEYQQIPDNDRGDAGLEGFTRTLGHAYQAYGCEEPTTVGDRYDKQRDKLTKDVAKFISNRPIFQRLFGTVRITRWALLVPHCDSKEIVSHATKKTAEVKAENLPYVADEFHVCVCQESDFPLARDQLINTANRTLEVVSEPSTPQEIADWAAANQGPSATLSQKLSRLPTLPNDQTRKAFQDQVLDWYLRGQEILDALRQHPEVYARVQAVKSHREGYLAAGLVSGAPPQDRLLQAINDLRTTLEQEVRQLHRLSSESLAYEAVADWLLRCPLDFPEVANA
jgi:hypothetical protein